MAERPLKASYPLVFFDALRVKIRDEGLVRNKAVYIALGVQAMRVMATLLQARVSSAAGY